MTFLSAAWLALFAPFAVLVWLTLRRPPREAVLPSAFFFAISEPTRAPRRGYRRPPAWVLATLAAVALAILALAEPSFRDPRPLVSVVIDPSFRITLGNESSTAGRALAMLRRASAGRIDLDVRIAGEPEGTTLRTLRPTARTTTSSVIAAVERQRQLGRDVVVISPILPASNPRVFTLTTEPIGEGPSIQSIAVRDDVGGSVDVFVRVARRPAATGDATITLRSGEATASQPIDWPAGSLTADATLRLAAASDVIEARVSAAGEAAPLDAVARVARTASTAHVAIAGAVPVAVERFVSAYARLRPAAASATIVTLTADAGAPGPSIVIASASGRAARVGRHEDHPIFAGVDLTRLATSSAAVPAGFDAVAWDDGGRPCIATRIASSGVRSVWVALDVAASAREPAFVVLLDTAIAWAGRAGGGWAAKSSDDVSSGWTARDGVDGRIDASPGTYVDSDGRLVAVNVANVAVQRSPARGDEPSLATWLASRDDARRTVPSGWPAVLAAAAALTAAMARRPSRLDAYADCS